MVRTRRAARSGAVSAALLALLAACSQEPHSAPSPTQSPPQTSPARSSPTASAAPTTPSASPRQVGIPPLRLREITRLDAPVAMAVRRGDSALYFAEKGGRVRALRGGTLSLVLDLRGQVSSGSEQGLLGLAFAPSGSHLYVNYTDTAGDTRIVEFRFGGGRADAGTRRELLRVDQPYANHNGGQILFGPDGKLYVGLGDGGAGGDPQNNAQSLGTLLGKILRIDPAPSAGKPYTIPADNPFVGRSGARGEIWAYGLRNPWRFTFDRQTGALWIGDVGQNAWEEINVAPPTSDGGENYGWDRLEGRHRFEGSPPPSHVLPVHEYSLAGGACAVTAGYAYRGDAIPGLRNWFLFADVCEGRVKALRKSSGNGTVRDLGLQGSNVVSFGEGAAGELFVLSLNGPVWRIAPA